MENTLSLLDRDARQLTWPDSAVQGVESVSWLVSIAAVITRIITC